MLTPNISLPTISQEFALNTIRAARGFGRLEGMITQLGKRLSDFGISITLAVSIPLQVLGGAIMSTFATLDDAVTKAFSKIIGASKEVKQEMFDAVVSLSQQTATSAVDLAGGLTELVASGYSSSEAIRSLWVADHLAVAGNMQLEDATKTLITALAAMQMHTGNLIFDQERMIHVSDLLVKAADATVGSVEDYSIALNRKAATALRLVNKSLEEGIAVLMAYIQAGVSAETASEYLNISLRDLQTSVIRKGKVWEKFGIDVFDKVTGSMKSMADIIEMLEIRFAGASDKQKRAALRMLGFQDRSVMATMKLFGLSQQIRQYEKDLESAGGTTEKVYKVQMTSLSKQMAITKNMIVAVGVGIGQILVPYMIVAQQAIRNLASWWNTLSYAQKSTAVGWGLVIAVLGPVVLALSVVILTIGRVIGMFWFFVNTIYTGVLRALGLLWTGLFYSAGAMIWTASAAIPSLVRGFGMLTSGIWTVTKALGWEIKLLRLSYVQAGLLDVGQTILGQGVSKLAALFNYLGLVSIAATIRAYKVLAIQQGYFAALSQYWVITAIVNQFKWWGFLIRQLGLANFILFMMTRPLKLVTIGLLGLSKAIWKVVAATVAWMLANWEITLALLVVSAIIAVVAYLLWNKLKKAFEAVKKAAVDATNAVVETMTSAIETLESKLGIPKVEDLLNQTFGMDAGQDLGKQFALGMTAGMTGVMGPGGAAMAGALGGISAMPMDMMSQLQAGLGGGITMPEMPDTATEAQKAQRDALTALGIAGAMAPMSGFSAGVPVMTGLSELANFTDMMANQVGGDYEEPTMDGKSKGGGKKAEYSALQYGTVEEYKARVQGQNQSISLAQKQLDVQKKMLKEQTEQKAATQAMKALLAAAANPVAPIVLQEAGL